MKKQDENPEEQVSDVEIGNLPERKYTIMLATMIQDLGKRMGAHCKKLQGILTKS